MCIRSCSPDSCFFSEAFSSCRTLCCFFSDSRSCSSPSTRRHKREKLSVRVTRVSTAVLHSGTLFRKSQKVTAGRTPCIKNNVVCALVDREYSPLPADFAPPFSISEHSTKRRTHEPPRIYEEHHLVTVAQYLCHTISLRTISLSHNIFTRRRCCDVVHRNFMAYHFFHDACDATATFFVLIFRL